MGFLVIVHQLYFPKQHSPWPSTGSRMHEVVCVQKKKQQPRASRYSFVRGRGCNDTFHGRYSHRVQLLQKPQDLIWHKSQRVTKNFCFIQRSQSFLSVLGEKMKWRFIMISPWRALRHLTSRKHCLFQMSKTLEAKRKPSCRVSDSPLANHQRYALNKWYVFFFFLSFFISSAKPRVLESSCPES